MPWICLDAKRHDFPYFHGTHAVDGSKMDQLGMLKTLEVRCCKTGVSENRGTPKSSILIGFSIINQPFWGTPIFGNTQM